MSTNDRMTVEGHEGVLERDPHSRAIINKDHNEFERFKIAQRAKKKQETRISDLETQVEHINTTMNEILTILKSK